MLTEDGGESHRRHTANLLPGRTLSLSGWNTWHAPGETGVRQVDTSSATHNSGSELRLFFHGRNVDNRNRLDPLAKPDGRCATHSHPTIPCDRDIRAQHTHTDYPRYLPVIARSAQQHTLHCMDYPYMIVAFTCSVASVRSMG